MDDDNKMGGSVDQILLLTTELLEKDKIVEIMKNKLIEKNEGIIISYQNNI